MLRARLRLEGRFRQCECLRPWARIAAALTLTLLPLAGCTTYEHVPAENIAMFNKRGRPVDPVPESGNTHWTFGNYEEMDDAEFDRYLDRMFRRLDAWTDERRQRDPTAKRRVLIFIHGGLNTPSGTVGRAVELAPQIEADGYYPIFINWRSSLAASYWDHLWRIRQGQDLYPWGTVMAPYYLAADLVRGIARLPKTAYFQLTNLWDLHIAQIYRALPLDRVPGTDFVDTVITTMREELGSVAPHDVSRVLQRRYQQRRDQWTGQHPDAIAVVEGIDRREWSDKLWPWFTYTVTLPTKLVSAIGIDATGDSAWDSMLRGVRILFNAEEDFRQTTPDVVPSGGLSRFMRRFRAEYAENSDEWEITLVGHSMGTIVLNQLVREFQDIRYDNLVYMAAACSLRDYHDTMFPYLRSEEGDKTELYHLTLHEQAEDGEQSVQILGLDPAIRGSLLIWIDSLFENPKTRLDLTLGRYVNLMTAVHNTPRELWSRIHIKSFDVGDHLNADGVMHHPQRHGDFTVARFWRREFWEPDGLIPKQSPPCTP